MKSLSSPLVLVSFCAVTLSGMGCDDSSPAGFSDPVEAQVTLTDVWCESAHACKDSYPAELAAFLPFEVFFGTDPSSCRTNLAPTDQQIADLRVAIAENRTTYHADRAASCYDAVTSLSCDEVWAENSSESACDAVFEGTIADGDSCTVNVECVSQDCDDGICAEDV